MNGSKEHLFSVVTKLQLFEAYKMEIVRYKYRLYNETGGVYGI